MRIIFVNRVLFCDIQRRVAFDAPRLLCIPIGVPPVVPGSIFKITVLDQLGIQSAVGSIRDIFKKDAQKFVGNRLCILRCDGNRSFLGLEIFKTIRIVNKTFCIRGIVMGDTGHFIKQTLDNRHRHLMYLSAHLSCRRKGKRVPFCLPEIFFIVILRQPVNQVPRCGISRFTRFLLIDLENQFPGSVCLLPEGRIHHAFLGSPVAVIRLHKSMFRAYFMPTDAIAAPGEMQAVMVFVFMGGVGKNIGGISRRKRHISLRFSPDCQRA